MKGTPARTDMCFRIGSMAISQMITVLLQLQDEGRLSLDDKLAKHRPGLPNADRITLRMLANFSVLSQVIEEVTGNSAEREIRKRVLMPLGLRHTQISRYAAFPGPALHSYTSLRGVYEDATFWSPSWTIGAGQVMSATIGDVALTARAVGRGALISPAAARERVADTSAGLPGACRTCTTDWVRSSPATGSSRTRC